MIQMTEQQYAAALAQFAKAENEAAYKSGRISVYNGPANTKEISQLEARVLAAIKNEDGEFTSQRLSKALNVSRPQVACAIRRLRTMGRVDITNTQRGAFVVTASNEGHQMPDLAKSDLPPPKEAEGRYTVKIEHPRATEITGAVNGSTIPKQITLAGPERITQEIR